MQSGSCHSSEERSDVNFHRSSPFLNSPSGVLSAYTTAVKSNLKPFFPWNFSRLMTKFHRFLLTQKKTLFPSLFLNIIWVPSDMNVLITQ